MLDTFDPDLVLLDVNFGDGPSGIHLAHVIKELHPTVTVMFLTAYPAALTAEASASPQLSEVVVVSKHDMADPKTLLECIESALRGSRRSRAPRIVKPGEEAVMKLSRTQLEVLKLVAMGWTNSAIAKMRKTQERAVEKQLKSIYSILGLESGGSINARVVAAERYLDAFGTPSDVPKPEDLQELNEVAEEMSENRAS